MRLWALTTPSNSVFSTDERNLRLAWNWHRAAVCSRVLNVSADGFTCETETECCWLFTVLGVVGP
jgi:hypothetical protein